MQKLSVSENIRLIREARGYSQEYIANKLNVTQQAYSNMEKKPETMTLGRLKELAKVLDVSLMVLIAEELTNMQQNINQQGGLAVTKIDNYINADNALKLYENTIKELREELKTLKQL